MSKPLVVLTYAPAGLGHLRVTDALKDGLPSDFDWVIFSPGDPTIETIHRFTSLNSFARRIMEWFQGGAPQRIFTKYYRKYLKTHTENIFLELTSLIKSQPSIPSKIIIVSTHFGLAYQIGVLKESLEKELKTEIKLVVQVTDDSPQYIWYVDVADLIIAPSQYTVDELKKYGSQEKLKKIPFSVIPYPVNPVLSESLSDLEIFQRQEQYNPESKSRINIIIPISGAAVGTDFFINLTKKLHRLSPRFYFHIVCRQAPFTKNFINKIQDKKYISLYVSESYKQIVDLYNDIYKNNIIAAEITKPSEQAFKALLKSNSIGGSFLFFAHPVGRQEYDNLNYLNRNNLLSITKRGVKLPFGSSNSADFIARVFSSGSLFESFKEHQNDKARSINTVALFWKEIKDKFC